MKVEAKHDQPAEPIDADQQPGRNSVDLPDGYRDRPPLPEQQQQDQAGEQHVGAALAGHRKDFGPPSFEGWARHNAVLDCKYAEQQQVDDDGLAQIRRAADVDRLWHEIIADETDARREMKRRKTA